MPCPFSVIATLLNSRGQRNWYTHSARLAYTSMVSQSHADVSSNPGTSGSGEEVVDITRTTTGPSPPAQDTNSSSLSLIRQQLETRGLSPDTVDIIMASWRQNTGKQYHSFLLRWLSHCHKGNINVEQADIQERSSIPNILMKKRLRLQCQ